MVSTKGGTKGIGERSYRVDGVGHGVEGSDAQRELVNNIEVDSVLLLHNLAKLLLLGGAAQESVRF